MAGKTYETNIRIGGQVSKSLSSSISAASSQLGGLTNSIKGIAKAAAGVFAGIKITGFLKDSVNEAISFESAMADVAKVVPGLKDSIGNITEDYAAMSNEILNMSTRLPMAADEITQLIAAAGQSGIAADELTRFAEDAAKMGVAFDLPADKAGEMAAVIRSSLSLTQDEFVVLADKINYFGNTTTQSADKLIEVVQAIGLIGKQAGVNADQIAAMSAAMNGMDAANMGTALSNIFGSLMTGSGATKAANEAWKSLGFTSTQVAKDMLKDSEGTMIKVFEAMKKLPKDQLSSTTAALFGNNKSTQMAIASFTENLDSLKQNFMSIGDATKYAGSMQEEFSSRAATTENKIQLAKNSIARLQITLGDLMLPVVAQGAIKFGDAINSMANKIPALIDKFKGFGGYIKSSLNLDEIYQDLKPKLPLIQNSAKYFAKNLISGIGKFIKGANLSDALSDSMLGLKGVLVQTLGKEKGDLLFGGIQGGIDRISGFIETVKLNVKEVASVFKDSFSPVFDAVSPAISVIVDVLNSIKTDEMSILTTILGGIKDAAVLAAPVLADLALTVLDSFKTAAPVITDVSSTVVKAVKAIVPFLVDMFSVITTNWGIVEPIIIGLGSAFAAWKIGGVLLDTTKSAISFGTELIKLPGKLISVATAQIALTKAKIVDKAETLYLQALYAKDFLVSLAGSTKAILTQTGAWIANKVQMGLQIAGMAALKAAQVVSTGVTTAMSAAQWALNAAFVASPIGWIVLGIGALIAAGVLLYKNWDTVKAVALSLWETISTAFKGIIDGTKTIFQGVIDFVTNVFTSKWSNAWQGVKDVFAGVFGALGSLVKTPLNAVIGLVNSAIDGINSISIKIPEWVPEWAGGGKTFGVSIPKIPMLAKGTDNFAGGMAIVGEQGPELINMSRGSQVITNAKTQGLIDSIKQIINVSPLMMRNQNALKHASELGSGGSGGFSFKVEISPTAIIYGDANESDVARGVKKGVEESVPMLQEQFNKMADAYFRGRRRTDFA